MSTPAAASPADANPQMPIGHPAGTFIHQPPPKPKPEPNELHVLLFRAIGSLKEKRPGDGALEDIGLRGTGAAMLIAYMTEEIGEKRLKKIGPQEVQDWVIAFKRQNPRVWICFQRGAIVQLVQALANDHARSSKASTDWQREVNAVLVSEPPRE